MTCLIIDRRDRSAAAEMAKEIGRAFREIRKQRGHHWIDVARRTGVPHSSVSRFERGESPNLQLGNAMRLLRYYGYTLAVVPIDYRSTR